MAIWWVRMGNIAEIDAGQERHQLHSSHHPELVEKLGTPFLCFRILDHHCPFFSFFLRFFMVFSISPAISLVISAPGRTPRAAWQVIQVDQNFGRSHRADARVAPCIIPKGKYVVTGSHWRLLGRLRLRSGLGQT